MSKSLKVQKAAPTTVHVAEPTTTVDIEGPTMKEVLERIHSRSALLNSLLNKLLDDMSVKLDADEIVWLSDSLNETVEDVERILDAPPRILDHNLGPSYGA